MTESWRAYRARLVANPDSAIPVDNGSAKWIYSGALIETGTVLIARDTDHHILRKPYLHKSVLLIVEHSASKSKALVLNRLAKRVSSTSKLPLFFGGEDGQTETFVLVYGTGGALPSNYKQPGVNSMNLLPGLWLLSGCPIQCLRNESIMPISDKFVLTGCMVWGEGELKAEMESDLWETVSMDAASLMSEMQHCQNGASLTSLFWPSRITMGEDVGEEMWNHLVGKIQKDIPMSRSCTNVPYFAGAMLSQWLSQQRLQFPMGLYRHGNLYNVHEGSLLISDPASFLFKKQYMFKAVVLVLERNDTEGFVLGIILNLPCAWASLPNVDCQFGGPLGLRPGRRQKRQALVGVHSRTDWAVHGEYEGIGPDGFYKISPTSSLLGLRVGKDFLANEGALFVRGFVAWKTDELDAELQQGHLFAASSDSAAAAAIRHRLQDEDMGRAANFNETVWEIAVLALDRKFKAVARPPPASRRKAAYEAGELAVQAWLSEMPA